MKYELIISTKASEEYEEIYSFYKDKSVKLGVRFSEELLEFIEKIESNPNLFQAEDSVYRRAHLKTFPYTVFYKVLDDRNLIEVVSIWPQAGRTRGWRK